MQAIVNSPRRGSRQQAVNPYLLALALSLLLHLGFLLWSRSTPLEGLHWNPPPGLLPPRFVVRQVTVDPQAFQNSPDAAPTLTKSDAIDPAKLVFAGEKPKAADVTPEIKPVETPKLVEEKPRAGTTPLSGAQLASASQAALDSQLSGLAGAFLNSAAVSKVQPVLGLNGANRGDGGAGGSAGAGAGVGGAQQTIDEALSKIGQVPTRESPVDIPGDALFAHDSVELGPESLSTLEKMAEFCRRFPDYIMVITGHTDTTGSADYNLRLSQRRADAVKDWLVRNKGISPSKLETIGRGSRDVRVPEGDVDQQAPNRRVMFFLRPVPSPAGNPARKAN